MTGMAPHQFFSWVAAAGFSWLLICSLSPSLGEKSFIYVCGLFKLFWIALLLSAITLFVAVALGRLTWA